MLLKKDASVILRNGIIDLFCLMMLMGQSLRAAEESSSTPATAPRDIEVYATINSENVSFLRRVVRFIKRNSSPIPTYKIPIKDSDLNIELVAFIVSYVPKEWHQYLKGREKDFYFKSSKTKIQKAGTVYEKELSAVVVGRVVSPKALVGYNPQVADCTQIIKPWNDSITFYRRLSKFLGGTSIVSGLGAIVLARGASSRHDKIAVVGAIGVTALSMGGAVGAYVWHNSLERNQQRVWSFHPDFSSGLSNNDKVIFIVDAIGALPPEKSKDPFDKGPELSHGKKAAQPQWRKTILIDPDAALARSIVHENQNNKGEQLLKHIKYPTDFYTSRTPEEIGALMDAVREQLKKKSLGDATFQEAFKLPS